VRRREFIAGLGGAAAWPLVARAQQPAMPPVIGYLDTASPAEVRPYLTAFLRGLREAGFAEGRNVAIEYRWAENQNDRLPALAADLVHRQVAVIATENLQPVLAAQIATKSIPIVFAIGGDPVEIGLVASLNRPSGNITGVTQQSVEVFAKRLELLHELVPAASSIALLTNPTNKLNAEDETTEAEKGARVHGVRLVVLCASSLSDLDMAFATLVKERAGGLLVSSDPFFVAKRDEVVALAARHTVPAIFHRREFAVAGGLSSYGPSLAEAAWQVGIYTGRILKGEKPADLPVQRPTKFEFAINLKTAKALGLTVPPNLLALADEVIE
jgi:putative tryptophan/tyrosine transport system substrate-binding protein